MTFKDIFTIIDKTWDIARNNIESGFQVVSANFKKVKSEVSGLDARITSLDADITALDARLTAVEADIASFPTEYLLLDGQSGGQVAYGGTASGDNLDIQSTKHATKGYILLQKSGGNVGIGSTAPGELMHVQGNNSYSGGTSPLHDAGNDRPSTRVSGQYPNMYITSNGNTQHGSTLNFWNFDNSSTTYQWNIGGGRNGKWSIGHCSNDSNPHAGINGYTGTYGTAIMVLEFDTNGHLFLPNITGTTGGSDLRYNTSTKEVFYDTSALRYKTNIRSVVNSDFIYNIPIKLYDRKDGNGKDEIGIIAEDLEVVAPSMVCYSIKNEAEIQAAEKEQYDKELEGNKEKVIIPEPIYQVESYSKSDFVPVIIDALQKLKVRVEALEK